MDILTNFECMCMLRVRVGCGAYRGQRQRRAAARSSHCSHGPLPGAVGPGAEAAERAGGSEKASR